jgi:hypothetical protein
MRRSQPKPNCRPCSAVSFRIIAQHRRIVADSLGDIGGGGIFAILQENQHSPSMYQVEKVYENGRSTGCIRFTPRNRVYTPFELTPGKDVEIVGRVVGKIARM